MGNVLDVSDIVRSALAVDGLSDFGPQDYREPLTQLVDSLNKDANLNQIGSTVMRQRLVDVLSTRLRVQHWVTQYPEILEEEILAPLVIIGLPRTGTTMLHRTIAADPRMQAPLWYETRFPSPPPGHDFAGPDPRIAAAQAEMQAMLDANPDLMAIHPMDALGPDEDIMLLEQSFYSYNIQAFANLPGFDAWLDGQDHTPGYRYLKVLLQFLQWQKRLAGRGGERWVLKAPHHVHFLPELFTVFPDARVVQSHRDPVETIPSLASLIAGVWVIYSDTADPAMVGRQWADKFARGLSRAQGYRDSVDSSAFLDLWFADTVRDPLTEIQRIYDFLGMTLTDEAVAEMQQWQDFNRRELRPPHEYTLAQFGFTEQGLKAQFRDYRERFIESREEH